MEYPEMLLWIIGIAVILFAASFFGKKAEWLWDFVLRNIGGTIMLYVINMGIAFFGVPATVGINAVTVITTGFLGLPGVILLYGLSIYRMVKITF